jgi:formate-dependent nitrite reductase membrane component NrfD
MLGQTIFFNGFLLFYTGLVLSWPFHPPRYSIPLVPVLLLSLFHGVQASTAIVRAHIRMAWSAIIVPTVVRISIAIVVVLMVGTYEVRPEPRFRKQRWLAQDLCFAATGTYRFRKA